jgi:hypothetical protein
MDYLRSFLGQQPTPLAAYSNNPAYRNASRRRVESLNNNLERARVNQLQRELLRNHPNWVQKAQDEINMQEHNNFPPTPQPAAPGANNRVRAAAKVPLPVNRNNLLAAKRKAAREEPNIWNMNQGRSLFQLGQPVPVQPVPVQPPPVQQSQVLLPSFVSTSRRNRRRHNTTPGLARAQARKREKLHAEIQRRNAARKALLANNGLGNNPFSAVDSNLLEKAKVRNARRLENNKKRDERAKEKTNANAFVSPVGLFGNNTFVENLGSNQNKMSNTPATGNWNSALELAGKEVAENPFINTSPPQVTTSFNMSQKNKNAKAAANARVAEAKKIYEENKYAREQEEARLKRNINAMAYAPGATNLSLGCTPCEAQIVAKLDTVLDRSKPSTAFSNGVASGKKTVQSALEATLLGLGEAAAAGKAGLGIAGAKVLAGAIRVGQAAAEGAKKIGTVTADAVSLAGSELEAAARTARRCIKGSPTGVNRSVRCAAAYAAVQAAADKLKRLLGPPYPPIPWPVPIPFPKFNYFTLRNANGKSQFNRNVNRTRGAIGRFGTRVATGLRAFGSRVRNVTGRAARAVRNTAGKGAGAVSRAMYRLSGREQADMIKQLLLDSMALKNQGKLTGRAVAELQAAMKAAQPGVVTADVVAEAAKVGVNLEYAPGSTNLVKPVANAKFGNAAAASPVISANNKARAAAAFGEQFVRRSPPGSSNIYSGGRKASRKVSRKNRKSSRKSSRKNRKASRRNRH